MEYMGIDGLKRTKYCGLLRDRTGIVQLAFGDETDRAIFDKASICRSEFVLAAKGIVRERSNKNPDIKTGSIEIFVSELRILSKSDVPPFEISDQNNTNIDLRLRYRYLDLRRGEMQKTLWLRHKIVKAARDYFDDSGFIDKSDIQNALLRSGKKIICDNDIDDLLKEVKVNDYGKISLNEFLKLFGINE